MVHFFDPRSSPAYAPLAGTLPRHLVDAYLRQARFDRLAGLAGLLPRGVDDLLSWPGSSRKDVTRMRDQLRSVLLVGLVRAVSTYQVQLGAYLAHAAPREAILNVVALDARMPRQPRQPSTGAPAAVRRRSARVVRRRSDLDDDFVFDAAGAPPAPSGFVGARWDAVRALARSWRAVLPLPGPCHDVDGF